jgi:16S rRNA (cytosine967-C5)-methyltransferase
MQNKGKIIALDTNERKLPEVNKRAKRADANIIETRHISSSKVIKRLSESADRLLLDVPCSGLGVLRRTPDIKWKLSPEALERIRTEQYDILNNYCNMTKKGGKMVYATCSILPSENEKQVRKFIVHHPEFKLLKENQVFTSDSGFDGFYMAVLERDK